MAYASPPHLDVVNIILEEKKSSYSEGK